MVMYQTPTPDFAHGDTSESSLLRPLIWPELVARLAAMRDLRRSLATGDGHSRGAFSGFADIREELSGFSCSDDSKAQQNELIDGTVNKTGGSVNPENLADGKGRVSNNARLIDRVNPGDREMT
jgi:hypothetical protein